jgi:hypothetical protein
VKIFLGDFNAQAGREDTSNPQMGMRVYMKSIMIMELEK